MAPAVALNISDDQRFALIKFRRSVADSLKAEHDDHYLLRWLRARNWNAEAAEKMLRDSLRWRATWGIDELDQWQPPEVIEKYYPAGVCGYDKEGSPVVVVPFAGLDMWGMLHSVPRSDFIKQTLKALEGYLKLCYEQSKIHGYQARQVVTVIDMEHFNLRQYAWRPAGEVVVSLVKMYEANYPETLKACYIINVPKVFAIAFSIIKNFLNEYTISKIQIYKNDPRKWGPMLLKHIDADQLPKYFGGNLVDENDDPKCSAFVPQGGKIPKSYYFKNKSLNSDNSPNQAREFTTSEVKKGAKLCLDFEAPSAGYLLKWEFRTDNHDIKFGVLRILPDGESIEEVPCRRVQSDDTDEIGVLTTDGPSKYQIVFDNTYSILRGKTVHHCIQVLPPLEANMDIVSTESCSQTHL